MLALSHFFALVVGVRKFFRGSFSFPLPIPWCSAMVSSTVPSGGAGLSLSFGFTPPAQVCHGLNGTGWLLELMFLVILAG